VKTIILIALLVSLAGNVYADRYRTITYINMDTNQKISCNNRIREGCESITGEKVFIVDNIKVIMSEVKEDL